MISLTNSLMIFLRVSMDAPGLFPRLGQILAESHQPRAIRGGKRWSMLRLFEGLELDLQVAQLDQLLALAPLQLTGNQPVIGIDGVVLSPCPSGLY
ncbi:hypothetical protein QA635_33180 [Bradyrhizobium brasilense]|uniref:hypothetical protein n=1 Tax=Bradyrhizobium brasilense TaxID=1419277 RepID=UPI0024B1FA9F|nr:hypothetical protein [Bradyrhizobium australafricanum]WFU31367.1 hypothetical protein QA635_33180 [Bradyrhizobium australafricanum]